MLIGLVLYFLSFVFFGDIEATLLEPRKKCVPTATVQGPCHECVCTAEGIFHCRPRACREEKYNNTNDVDCETNFMYRQDTVFCTCSSDGLWISENCQLKFRNLRPNNSLMHNKLRTNVLCIPNTLYIIDCNICECQSNGYIEITSCTKRRCFKGHKADRCRPGDILRLDQELCTCSDINYYIDRLCVKILDKTIQRVTAYELSKLDDVGRFWRRLTELKSDVCDSRNVYTVDCNQCVCVAGQSLVCSTRICTVTHKKMLRHIHMKAKEPDSWPQVESEDSPCKPGIRYRFKCNTCLCSDDGVLSCTTMVCLTDYLLDLRSLRAVLSSI